MPRVAAALSFVVVLGCSRGPGSSSAIADAGSAEIGADAPPGSPDATADGGAGLFDRTWVPLPGAPTTCGNILAAEPSSVPGLQWENCPSGRDGCRRSTIPWTDQPGAALALPDLEPIRIAHGSVWFIHRRQELESFKIKRTLLTVQKLDGAPVLAMQLDPNRKPACLFAASVGEYGVGLLGTTGTADGPLLVASMSWGGTPTTRSIPYDATFGSAIVQRLAIGAQHAFLEQRGPTAIRAFEIPDGPLVSIADPSETPRAVEHGVLGQHLATSGISLSRPTGTTTVLRRPESGRVVSWLSVDRTTNAVIWVESVPGGDGSFSAPALWTAPYAQTESEFVARKVGVLPESPELGAGGRDIVANAGAVLVLTSPTAATIVRLSDGHQWKVSSEPDLRFVSPLWIDGDEVLLSTTDASLVGVSISRVLRIARSSLGAGT